METIIQLISDQDFIASLANIAKMIGWPGTELGMFTMTSHLSLAKHKFKTTWRRTISQGIQWKIQRNLNIMTIRNILNESKIFWVLLKRDGTTFRVFFYGRNPRIRCVISLRWQFLSGEMKCVERINVKIASRSFVVILFYRLMASGKFRLVLLLIVVMASSLLMEDIRSKVWQFVKGTS